MIDLGNTKKCLKNPHGTFCGMGTKVILFPDIPVIVKNQFKKCVIGVHGTPIFLLD